MILDALELASSEAVERTSERSPLMEGRLEMREELRML